MLFRSVCLHHPISIAQYFSHYSWTPHLLLYQSTSILLPVEHFHPHQNFCFLISPSSSALSLSQSRNPNLEKCLNFPRLVRTIFTSEQHLSLRCVQRHDLLRHDPFPSDADEETKTHKNFSSFLASSGPSPVNNTQLSDVYSGAISSVVTHFPVAPTSNNNNVTHFPILSRRISSDPRQCYFIP